MDQFGAGELAGGDWEDVQYQPELDATLPQQDLGDENNDDTFGAFDGPLCEYPPAVSNCSLITDHSSQPRISTSKLVFKQCPRCAKRGVR